MITLDEFEALAKSRRATRHFRSDRLPAGMIERLIEIARWAPSGYNLQPTHFVIVADPATKSRLRVACLNQSQVAEAPIVIVFTGDRHVFQNNFADVLAADKSIGAIDPDYERRLRKFVPLAFVQGPGGFGWLAKAIAAPLLGLFMPTPSIPAVFQRNWLTKQVMLCAMNLMLAATAAGLATAPMEGFDERRVKRVLGIPRSHLVPLVMPIGYAVEQETRKSRLSIGRFIHSDRW